ncbi:MAG: hypothetical protein MMC23_002835 [Stictis urceolatum]|nr:hypothetical protein [Stictis urceolata]
MRLLSLLSFLPVALSQLTGTYTALPAVSPNPSNVQTYIYLPKKLAPNPPVVVVPHWCHGSAEAAYQGSGFSYNADTYGFIVLYPDSPNTVDKCWDVSSNATLTHNGGGDSQGIISAVKYTLQTYNADPKRIFVQGTSSGAMMTNVLLGAYPDVFAAGSAWAGVAFGCFSGPSADYWNADCATGLVNKTGAQWKAIVDAAYPGYTGYRPKLQTFHGSVDTTLYPQNLQEQIKEWTAVFGLSETPSKTLADTPISGWTMKIFGDGSKFEATLASGVDHNIQTQWDTVNAWFDLLCTGTGCFGRPDNGISGSSGGCSYPVSTKTMVTSTVKSTPITWPTTSIKATSTSAAPGSSSGAAQWAQW